MGCYGRCRRVLYRRALLPPVLRGGGNIGVPRSCHRWAAVLPMNVVVLAIVGSCATEEGWRYYQRKVVMLPSVEEYQCYHEASSPLLQTYQ
jgi:hypothetical protein